MPTIEINAGREWIPKIHDVPTTEQQVACGRLGEGLPNVLADAYQAVGYALHPMIVPVSYDERHGQSSELPKILVTIRIGVELKLRAEAIEKYVLKEMREFMVFLGYEEDVVDIMTILCDGPGWNLGGAKMNTVVRW